MNASKSCYFRAEDPQTRRWECIAVSGLGLAGIILIMTAVTDSIKFAQNREAIIQAWSTSGQTRMELAGRSPDQTLTNELSTQAATVPMHADRFRATPASEGKALRPECQSIADRAVPRWKFQALR